jgi:hypothetical protein
MRAAYGFRRTLAVAKSIWGISRRDAFVGSVCLGFLFARFIEIPLRPGCLPRADDPRFIFINLHVDGDENEPVGDRDKTLR